MNKRNFPRKNRPWPENSADIVKEAIDVSRGFKAIEHLRKLIALSDEIEKSEWGINVEAEQDLRKRCAFAYAEARKFLQSPNP
jgi:hypothetical protein